MLSKAHMQKETEKSHGMRLFVASAHGSWSNKLTYGSLVNKLTSKVQASTAGNLEHSASRMYYHTDVLKLSLHSMEQADSMYPLTE